MRPSRRLILTATNQLRRKLLGLPEKAPETAEDDLVVVGGGYSGMGALRFQERGRG